MTPRPFRPEDRASSIELFETSDWRAEAAALREERDEPRIAGDWHRRWVVAEEGPAEGGLVGYARLAREAHEAPGDLNVQLLVRPDARGWGVGRALWTYAVEAAFAEGGTRLHASVRDDDPLALAFARRRGFGTIGHLFESVLDLETFEAARFSSAAPEELRVFSMADVPDDETHRRKLWRLNDWDIDAGTGACRPFERFDQEIFGGYWYRPEGQIVAALGDEWVGLAAVGMTGEGKGYNMMTGVVPAYRGRGIATALKLATIAWARQAGAREIWTHNDSENGPMLAINRKLGYRSVPGYYRLRALIVNGGNPTSSET